MRPLPMPARDARDTYLICISRVRDDNLANRLLRYLDSVDDASRRFEKAARERLIYALDRDSFGPVPRDRRKEVAKVYTDRMVKEGAPGRIIYDELRTAAVHCPLCGHRLVATLDHHLPKSSYPFLAVAPANLIPACTDCNKIKTDLVPTRPQSQTLHPYFDNVDSDCWLNAEVLESRPAAMRFYVDPPNGWSHVLAARVEHHFKVFGLAVLYGSSAAAHLVGMRAALGELHSVGGKNAVREDMERNARSWEAAQRNHWMTASYRALAASDWFCAGGFQS